MLAIVVIVFVAELVVMAGISSLGYSADSFGIMLFDAGLLALVTAPPVYWLVLNPIHREYEKRLKAESEAEGEEKNLWSAMNYRNFKLIVDWRQPDKPVLDKVPVILPDGSYQKDDNGDQLTIPVMDVGDSGIYLRGSDKAQVNIWNWPCGSGEFYGYRLDMDLPASGKPLCLILSPKK